MAMCKLSCEDYGMSVAVICLFFALGFFIGKETSATQENKQWEQKLIKAGMGQYVIYDKTNCLTKFVLTQNTNNVQLSQ